MPSITTAVNRLLWLTSRHLGGGRGRDVPSPCLRVSPGTVFRQRVDHPTARPLIKASSRPCLLCLTGNGFQCEQSTNPHRPAATAASSRPLPGGGQCMAIAPDTVHGEQELDFGEGDRVYGREVACFRGSASMGNRPRGEAARRGGGWNIPLPCPDVSPGTVFVEHPFPCLLRLWLNVFRLTNPHLPLPPPLNAVSQKTAPCRCDKRHTA